MVFEVLFLAELKKLSSLYKREDYEKSIALITANELPFEDMITDVQPLSNIQEVFENIDKNPNGLKVLMDCQA